MLTTKQPLRASNYIDSFTKCSGELYRVNHKTWQFIVDYNFGYRTLTVLSLYHFNREEILHATVVKFTTSP